jgi:hypothetical protein
VWSYTSATRNTPSWRGAQLKHRDFIQTGAKSSFGLCNVITFFTIFKDHGDELKEYANFE